MSRVVRVRLILGAMSLLAICGASGCMGPAFFANLLSKQKTKALYELQDRATLILVDDPAVQLGSGVLASVISDQIMYQLREEKVVSQFVELSRLNDVKVELGQDYPTTSIDRIGKAVDALQVIYVHIDSVTRYPQPGVFMPKAELTVKVIDVEEGKRLFPPTDFDTRPRGHTMSVDLGIKIAAELETGSDTRMMRELASRIAREVARLFHAYHPDSLGERSNDTPMLEH